MNKKREYWPYLLLTIMVIFIFIMLTMVIIAFKQPLNMVDENYYEESLSFQDKKDSQDNAKNLKNPPEIIHEGQNIIIIFPSEIERSKINGKIMFYSPLSKSEDFQLDLMLDSDNKQFIDISKIRPGQWSVSLEWQDGQLSYLIKKAVVLNL